MVRKLLLALGVVLVAGVGYASAAPIRPIVAAVDEGIVLAACNPGTPNCVKPSGNRPTFCGSVSNPCTIDGGLGSECQGGGTCGTGPSGPPGNPYFPYGQKSGVAPQTPSLTQPKAPVVVK